MFAPLVAPHDPDALGTPFETPSLDHPLGTDHLGRDTFSRIIYGAQVSLRSGFQIVGIALIFAVPLGLLAGFRGGGVDVTLMRVMDGLASFPPLVLALAVVGMLGAGLQNAILAISFVMIPGFARLMRAQTLAVREETFIEASHSMGTTPGPHPAQARSCPTSRRRSSWRRRSPIGFALIAEAQLSLLGFGVQRPTSSWGTMIQDARLELSEHPWQVFIPSLALVFTILAFNTLGDGIRDALGLGMPKGKQRIKGRLGLTTVTRPADQAPPPASDRLLSVVRPLGRVPHRERARHRRRPRELRRRRRRGRGAGGRIRLGQDGLVAGGDATGRVASRSDHERLGALRRP